MNLLATCGDDALHTERIRIHFLDGLRGIAILSVVIYHSYGATYSSYLPFGDRYSGLYPIRFGWLGVQLFFLISGFVILMTLEKCRGLRDFALRRWLRLFPAMLVASLIILAFDLEFGVGPYADRSLINLLPGCLFINPSLIKMFTGMNIVSMDGPFWSLYVEVSFYFVFGISFFLWEWRRAIGVVFALFAICVVSEHLASAGYGGHQFAKVAAAMNWLGFIHFGWFACGALLYKAYSRSHSRTFALALVVGVISVFTTEAVGMDWTTRIALLAVMVIFAVALVSTTFQNILAWRGITFLGFVSYPLYLIHNNIIVGMTYSLSKLAPEVPAVLTPIFPIVLVTAIAWIIARYIEPAIKSWRRYRGSASGNESAPQSDPTTSSRAIIHLSSPTDFEPAAVSVEATDECRSGIGHAASSDRCGGS
jgi:peptidoglycan/LPS O-acetylase OafA/YrhL